MCVCVCVCVFEYTLSAHVCLLTSYILFQLTLKSVYILIMYLYAANVAMSASQLINFGERKYSVSLWLSK